MPPLTDQLVQTRPVFRIPAQTEIKVWMGGEHLENTGVHPLPGRELGRHEPVQETERPTPLVLLRALVITTAIGLAVAYLLTSSLLLHIGFAAARRALAVVAPTAQAEELLRSGPAEPPALVILARRSE
jgi:hypothetical protein